jgi:hypothetical protein
VSNSFGFIHDYDEPEDIRSELIEFLDGYDWHDFLESVENKKRVAKNALISSFMRKIEAGMTTPEIIFKTYTPKVLTVRCILFATMPMLGKVDMVGILVDGNLLQRVYIAPTTVNSYTTPCGYIVTHTRLGTLRRNTQVEHNLWTVDFKQHPF